MNFYQISRITAGIGIIFLMLAACQQPSEECLSIAFTGDVLLDRGVRQQIRKKGVEHLFESVTPLFRSVDATVINLECPITSVRSPLHKKYIFRAEPIWATVLSQAGITHAAMANNHTIDQGRNGLTDTNQYLLSSGITPVGYGDTSPQSCQPVLIKKGKIEVALYNSVALPLENWVYLENSPGICQQPIEELKEEITNFKRQNPKSYIVVILHWGVEYQPLPTLVPKKRCTLAHSRRSGCNHRTPSSHHSKRGILRWQTNLLQFGEFRIRPAQTGNYAKFNCTTKLYNHRMQCPTSSCGY